MILPLIDEQVVYDDLENPEDPYYEGIMEIRRDTVDGEVVGHAYLETSFRRP